MKNPETTIEEATRLREALRAIAEASPPADLTDASNARVFAGTLQNIAHAALVNRGPSLSERQGEPK